MHDAEPIFREHAVTRDGIERTAAANIVEPFARTSRQLDSLRAARPGRVIWVVTWPAYTERLDVRYLEMPAGSYDGWVAYARAQRARIVLAAEWAHRMGRDEVVFHALHPRAAGDVRWLATADEPAGTSGRFWRGRRPRSAYPLPRTRHDPTEARRLWDWCVERAGVTPPV